MIEHGVAPRDEIPLQFLFEIETSMIGSNCNRAGGRRRFTFGSSRLGIFEANRNTTGCGLITRERRDDRAKSDDQFAAFANRLQVSHG